MEWILSNLPLVIFFFIVYSIASAVKRARDKKIEHESSRDETAEQRGVREIQERIRRIAAERRGGRVPADEPPPVLRPVQRSAEATPPPLETLGGPLKRMLEEIERRAQPPPAPPPLVARMSKAAEAERQERYADELQALEEAKIVAQRRAAHVVAAQQAEAASRASLRAVARTELIADLHDTHSLRRAFVLREVLGPPVGLR